jgi:hypothetical protein
MTVDAARLDAVLNDYRTARAAHLPAAGPESRAVQSRLGRPDILADRLTKNAWVPAFAGKSGFEGTDFPASYSRSSMTTSARAYGDGSGGAICLKPKLR